MDVRSSCARPPPPRPGVVQASLLLHLALNALLVCFDGGSGTGPDDAGVVVPEHVPGVGVLDGPLVEVGGPVGVALTGVCPLSDACPACSSGSGGGGALALASSNFAEACGVIVTGGREGRGSGRPGRPLSLLVGLGLRRGLGVPFKADWRCLRLGSCQGPRRRGCHNRRREHIRSPD